MSTQIARTPSFVPSPRYRNRIVWHWSQVCSLGLAAAPRQQPPEQTCVFIATQNACARVLWIAEYFCGAGRMARQERIRLCMLPWHPPSSAVVSKDRRRRRRSDRGERASKRFVCFSHARSDDRRRIGGDTNTDYVCVSVCLAHKMYAHMTREYQTRAKLAGLLGITR